MMDFKSVAGLSAVAILILGCQTQVIGGGSGGGTSSGTKNDTTSGGGQGGTTVHPTPHDDGPAIAMLSSQITPAGGTGTTVGSTSTGGSGVDANTLVLFVSDAAQSCADPFQGLFSCATPRYQVTIGLPPNLQAVGTYSLNQLASMGESDPGDGSGGPNSCSGGGGSYWDGTITISAIDGTHVDFTLAGTGQLIGVGGNADGTYTALRCVF